jgi:hypothetical protein
MNRADLLTAWGSSVIQACHSGALASDPIAISQWKPVKGPRAGALLLHAGLQSGQLVQVMSKNDAATLRQFIPWDFAGEPSCFMSGRFVRMEAGWPDSLADKNVKLKDLGSNPKTGGRWIAGKNEAGQTVTLGLDNEKPHWLIAGTTGSGKSYAMRLAVGQLCRDNRLILVDGKWGEGLDPVSNVVNQIGPLAKDIETAKQALSWAVGEMRRRYESPNGHKRLVIVCDEIQEFCQDSLIAELLRRLVTQGRAANVHCIVGTQHPTVKMFGDVGTIKRNIPGRLALKVLDYKSSEVAIGHNTPRADYLLGAGDSYCISPSACHRTQLAYLSEDELANLPHSEPELSEWPEYNAESGGTLDEVKWEYSGQELGVSLISAVQQEGRRKLIKALQEEGLTAGSVRADRLLSLGREQYQWLIANGWKLDNVPMCLAQEHTRKRGFEAFLECD